MLKKLIKSISIIIFIVSISYIFINIIIDNQNKKINDNLVSNYINNKEYDNNYYAVISIPKINLLRGFYSINDNRNDLSKNIYYLPESTDNTIILASHRGTSIYAYFNNLDKLTIGDSIYLYYQDNVYEYILNDIYKDKKDGHLSILRDSTKYSLILITCNKLESNYQNIYVAYKGGNL